MQPDTSNLVQWKRGPGTNLKVPGIFTTYSCLGAETEYMYSLFWLSVLFVNSSSSSIRNAPFFFMFRRRYQNYVWGRQQRFEGPEKLATRRHRHEHCSSAIIARKDFSRRQLGLYSNQPVLAVQIYSDAALRKVAVTIASISIRVIYIPTRNDWFILADAKRQPE